MIRAKHCIMGEFPLCDEEETTPIYFTIRPIKSAVCNVIYIYIYIYIKKNIEQLLVLLSSLQFAGVLYIFTPSKQ